MAVNHAKLGSILGINISFSAPDGYYRKLMVVSGKFSGPTVGANDGDTIVVLVKNDLDIGVLVRAFVT